MPQQKPVKYPTNPQQKAFTMAPNKRVEQTMKVMRDIFPDRYPTPQPRICERAKIEGNQDSIPYAYRHSIALAGLEAWMDYGFRPKEEILAEYENPDWIMSTMDVQRDPIPGFSNGRWVLQKERVADEFYAREGFIPVDGFSAETMHWQECLLRWLCKYYSVYPSRAFIRMNTQAGFRLYGHMLDVTAASLMYKHLIWSYHVYKDSKIPDLTNRNNYRLAWLRQYMDSGVEALWKSKCPDYWEEIDKMKKEATAKYFDVNLEGYLVHFGRLTKDQEKYMAEANAGS